MRTRELQFLHQLFRLRSISEAARAVHTTQPNASKMLKKLEDHFGFQLFERQGGQLHPTEAALLIEEQVETTLLSFLRIESSARNLREKRHGSLAVGTTPHLSRNWVPKLMADYMISHPAVITSIHTRSSRKLIELVDQRQLDFAVGLIGSDDPNVICRKLFDTELVAALPKTHPLCKKDKLQARDFHQLEFVTASTLDRSREKIEEFFKTGNAQPIERGEASLSVTRLRLVERGIGLTLVDNLTANDYKDNLLEFKPLEPTVRMTVWLMRPKFRTKSRLADSFEQIVMKHAKLDFSSN